MKVTQKIKFIFLLFLISLNSSCDQVSKNIVRQHIEPNGYIEVIKNKLILTKVENTGAAYSLGSNLTPFLKILLLQIFPIIILGVLLRQLFIKTDYSKETNIGFAFIIGGGIGNLFDRIMYGSVTDFLILDLGIIKTEIFNLADVSIMLGTILILFSTLLHHKKSLFKYKK
ncbi:signal peptidase II [Aquimarina longa]|uniref:signal peptidase II n=1 Tax=Aquimarina longa TaxID=1080221 RepID=UPI000B26ABA6|nr:signal peptidase II [Aquimarina longa]